MLRMKANPETVDIRTLRNIQYISEQERRITTLPIGRYSVKLYHATDCSYGLSGEIIVNGGIEAIYFFRGEFEVISALEALAETAE